MNKNKYDIQIQNAEKIIDDAKFVAEYSDSDVNVYYELRDKIEKLKLNKIEKDFYFVRLDVILGDKLK